MKFWIEYLIIAILILLTGFLIFWSAFGRIDRFMDSVNWKENFGGLEPEPRLKTSFLSASLGPAVISDNSVKPQASFAGEEKPKRKKEKVGGPGDAEVSGWKERVDYWADYYSLKEQDKKTIKNIIYCESKGDKNAIGDNGSSLGIAQFKKSTFFEQMTYYNLKLNLYSWDDQIRLMSAMAGDKKWSHWTCYKNAPKL